MDKSSKDYSRLDNGKVGKYSGWILSKKDPRERVNSTGIKVWHIENKTLKEVSVKYSVSSFIQSNETLVWSKPWGLS